MSTPSPVPAQYYGSIREISQSVLTELVPDEVELALGFLDPMIEMAAGDEVLTVDTSGDHVGGFGGTDMLAMSVVPAVFKVLTRVFRSGRPTPSELDDILSRSASEIEAVVRRVGSQSAVDRLPELTAAIRKATLRHFACSRNF